MGGEAPGALPTRAPAAWRASAEPEAPESLVLDVLSAVGAAQEQGGRDPGPDMVRVASAPAASPFRARLEGTPCSTGGRGTPSALRKALSEGFPRSHQVEGDSSSDGEGGAGGSRGGSSEPRGAAGATPPSGGVRPVRLALGVILDGAVGESQGTEATVDVGTHDVRLAAQVPAPPKAKRAVRPLRARREPPELSLLRELEAPTPWAKKQGSGGATTAVPASEREEGGSGATSPDSPRSPPGSYIAEVSPVAGLSQGFGVEGSPGGGDGSTASSLRTGPADPGIFDAVGSEVDSPSPRPIGSAVSPPRKPVGPAFGSETSPSGARAPARSPRAPARPSPPPGGPLPSAPSPPRPPPAPRGLSPAPATRDGSTASPAGSPSAPLATRETVALTALRSYYSSPERARRRAAGEAEIGLVGGGPAAGSLTAALFASLVVALLSLGVAATAGLVPSATFSGLLPVADLAGLRAGVLAGWRALPRDLRAAWTGPRDAPGELDLARMADDVARTVPLTSDDQHAWHRLSAELEIEAAAAEAWALQLTGEGDAAEAEAVLPKPARDSLVSTPGSEKTILAPVASPGPSSTESGPATACPSVSLHPSGVPALLRPLSAPTEALTALSRAAKRHGLPSLGALLSPTKKGATTAATGPGDAATGSGRAAETARVCLASPSPSARPGAALSGSSLIAGAPTTLESLEYLALRIRALTHRASGSLEGLRTAALSSSLASPLASSLAPSLAFLRGFLPRVAGATALRAELARTLPVDTRLALAISLLAALAALSVAAQAAHRRRRSRAAAVGRGAAAPDNGPARRRPLPAASAPPSYPSASPRAGEGNDAFASPIPKTPRPAASSAAVSTLRRSTRLASRARADQPEPGEVSQRLLFSPEARSVRRATRTTRAAAA